MNKITKFLRRHWVSFLQCSSKKLTFLPQLSNLILKISKIRVSISLVSIVLVSCLCIVFGLYPGQPTKSVVLRHLDDVTFMVETKGGTGTGTLFSRKDNKGDWIHFIWTAGHVIEHNKIGPDEKMEVTFKDVNVSKINLVNGAMVDKTSYKAKVIKFSGPKGGDDLALLELVDHNLFSPKDNVVFAGPELVEPGSLLYHVGCMYGETGYNSVSEGMLANNGRIIYGKVFDQTSTTVFPGSSGGGVFNVQGEYVGMVTLMRAANMNYMVPLRRMIYWARENNVEWALNKDVHLPRDYVRHNLYKDSELDSDFEQFRYFMMERWKKGLDIQLDMKKQLQKLKEELDATRKQLGITNSVVVPSKTNNAAQSFILRFFGPPDADGHDDNDGDEDDDEN